MTEQARKHSRESLEARFTMAKAIAESIMECESSIELKKLLKMAVDRIEDACEDPDASYAKNAHFFERLSNDSLDIIQKIDFMGLAMIFMTAANRIKDRPITMRANLRVK